MIAEFDKEDWGEMPIEDREQILKASLMVLDQSGVITKEEHAKYEVKINSIIAKEKEDLL